ncbi:MAG: hypothetical protein KGR46_07435 [Verrucomicrobia bacterium]|nr:hypothetical protein [Verrucomicrobiota bacterium]
MAEGNAISVKIGAETDGIEQGLRSIQSSLGRLENSSKQSGDIFDASFGKIAGATAVGQLAVKAFTGVVDAAFAGVRNTVAEFGNALDLGGRLSDLSGRTGETAGNLLLLERAFDNSGVGAEKVGQSVNKLQKFMEDASAGGKNQTEVMNALGLSLADLSGKAPTEQMQIFASRIAGIEDPGKRAALAMEIFGKSGGELLPLLTNFSGELETARGQLGSMTDIMDRRAAVFDSVSDKIAIISTKFTDFAAGILDRAIPALDAITEGLSRIDAAGVGQKLADAFLGGTGAMAGFQQAVDAFSTGNISGALSILWDSVVLQAQMTANSIYKNLSAAFATAGDVLGQIFRSDGPAFMTIISAFDYLSGYIKSTIAGSLADTFASLGPAFTNISEGLRIAADAGAASAELALQRIPVAAGLAAEDIAAKLGAAPELFKQNLTTAGDIIPGLTEKAALLAETTGQSSDKAAAFTANLGDGRRKMEALIEAQKSSYDQETAKAEAAAQTSVEAQKAVQLEIDLNNAKAAGNEELVKELESRKQAVADQEKINKLTEEYKKLMPEEVARQMAQELVNSQNAAAGLSTNTKTFASWLDYIEGTQPEEPVKKMSEKAADARKEIEAFGKYIGTDLSGMSFPDIAKKLGVDTLGTTGSDQIDAILSHLDSERQKLQGIIPVDESGSKTKIDELGTHLEKNFKKSVDLALNGSDGSKILSEVKTLVSGIKDLVAKIEPKLPQQALA